MLDITNLSYDFNVLEEKAYLQNGTELPNTKVFVHPNTGEILGQHSDNYTPINYPQVVDNLLTGIKEANLTSDYTEPKISVYDGGRKLKAEIRFPDLTINPNPELRDLTEFRISMFTSHDGTWKYQVSADGLRLTCLNGQTFADALSRISLKHTKFVDVDPTAGHVINQYETFKDKESLWHDYSRNTLSDQIVEDFFKSTIVKKKTYSSVVKNNEVQLENLFSLYVTQTHDLGNTQWALYNCLTNWATHTDYTDNTGRRLSKSPHNSTYDRTKQIETAMKSKAWENLCL